MKLPPLNSLRAFEISGRRLSFSKAAAELNVTPGAISQQIRVLEEFLDVKLFKRRNRTIVLTDAGQLCLPLITDGFTSLSEAVKSVRQFNCDGPLTISSAPTFVSKWLIPRLCKFHDLHPDIDVRIDASTRLADFIYDDIDVGIRFGTGEFPGLESIYLFSFDLIPVCSPKLINQGKGLRQLSDIRHQTLLHSDLVEFDPSWPDWTMWLATANVTGVDPTRGIFFSQNDMMLEAALGGQGIALVSSVAAANDIEAGRLVQPFETRLPVRLSYHFVTSKQKSTNKKVVAFRQWLLDESAYLRDSRPLYEPRLTTKDYEKIA
ncbi:MAG: LysR family glycine cleavage system transcriptional activator [Gammaproteobacteria bacterium]|jgi:LysR family glycine cleavage system transcriptional activator